MLPPPPPTLGMPLPTHLHSSVPPPHTPQGALVREASMADSRRMASSRSQVQAVLSAEHRRLRDTLFELLVKNAPSARK